jgi:1,4-alpha-glucan branching enzyme
VESFRRKKETSSVRSDTTATVARRILIASVAESTFTGDYERGFSHIGYWREVFNGDYYDTFPNPAVQNNADGFIADGPSRHGMPTSARITVPANSLIVFATDDGDPL